MSQEKEWGAIATRAEDAISKGSKVCGSCGKPIVWVKTKKSHMPIDAYPDPLGKFELCYSDTGKQLSVVYRGYSEDEPRYSSHFSTCPQADEWRKTKNK